MTIIANNIKRTCLCTLTWYNKYVEVKKDGNNEHY